jgi:hypothetical protein
MDPDQIAEVPLLVKAGISVPTFLLAILILIAARAIFMWRPTWHAYHYINAAGWLSAGWAFPRPIGVVLLVYGLICLAMGFRAQRHTQIIDPGQA